MSVTYICRATSLPGWICVGDDPRPIVEIIKEYCKEGSFYWCNLPKHPQFLLPEEGIIIRASGDRLLQGRRVDLNNPIYRDISLDYFVVTSYINLYTNSVFTPEQRLVQVRETIDSILYHFPYAVIILVEGGSHVEETIHDRLSQVNYVDVSALEKNQGELVLLTSVQFDSCYDYYHKLSGRYSFLPNTFIPHLNNHRPLIKRNRSWQPYVSPYYYCTRYYRWHRQHLESVLKKLREALDVVRENIDVEHAFYLLQIFQDPFLLEDLDIQGYIAPTGRLLVE